MPTSINVTILVGNGFDLSLGLDTSAKAFIREFVEGNRTQNYFDDTPAGRLAEIIDKEGVENWSDFESKFGQYSKLVLPSADTNTRAREYMDAKKAIDSAQRAKIRKENSRIDDAFLEENANECVDSIAGWFVALSQGDQNAICRVHSTPITGNYRYISFNYTDTLERILMAGNTTDSGEHNINPKFPHHKINGRVVHAHGSLNGTPVCGVDNETQIADEELCHVAGISETTVKSGIQELCGSVETDNAMNLIKQSSLILVYGMSLGRTDERWWNADYCTLIATPVHATLLQASTLDCYTVPRNAATPFYA